MAIELRSLKGTESPALVRRLLESLPDWFAIEASRENYIRDVAALDVVGAFAGGEAIGFASLKPHTQVAGELHLIAVAQEWHGKGIGRALLAAIEEKARTLGLRFLTVKTLAPSADYEPYVATRAFYLARGFLPLEVFPTLWSAEDPCLLLLKVL